MTNDMTKNINAVLQNVLFFLLLTNMAYTFHVI